MVAAPELPRNLAGRQLGRYEVLTQLASGGMAAVYVARARGVAGFERLVAIKVLHPHLAYEEEFISMFLDEARLAARIRHPNVVPTLDISDTDGDGFFLVMEFIEGDHFGSLLGHAARGGERVPANVTSRIVLDALAGLGAAHRLTDEAGQLLHLVHRDVSPHNIMVGADGIGRLTDFGVAKAEKRLSSTRAGQFKGKLAYMAPEQASTGYADQRSDLFSMGIILWESLTGRRLFRGENNAATLTKILHEDIPSPSALWDDLGAFDELLKKALDRDPAQRFQTAEDFAIALEEAARNHAGIATGRGVADEVKHWLGERIETQRARVRDAIDQLGRSEYSEAAIPIPRESSASNVTISGRRRPVTESQALSAVSQVAEVPQQAPKSRKGLLVAALLLLLVGVGAGVWAAQQGTGTGETIASEAPTVETSQAPPPTEVAGPTEVTPPTETGDTAGTDTESGQPETGDSANGDSAMADTADSTMEAAESSIRPIRGNRRPRGTGMRRPPSMTTMEAPAETEMATETVMATPMHTATPTMATPMSGSMDDLEFNPYR